MNRARSRCRFLAPSPRRLAARGALAFALAAGFVALGAAPAGAHGLAGAQPTNFVSRVRSVTPAVAGLHVSVRDLGARIEVRNDTSSDVVILGYQGEPYLRVGPSGVYENRRSPSVFLNRSQTITAVVPRSYRADATPQWHRTGGGRVVFWHDHRVHWMGASVPQAVHDSPGDSHLVSRWNVALQYQGQLVSVRGDLRWVPGPSALPRLALALLAAVLVVGLGFTRWWGYALVAVLLVVAALVAVLVGGAWSATSGGAWTAFLSTAYSTLGIAVTLAAAGALWRARREPSNGSAMVLVAAVILTFGSGLADITFLSKSQLPTTLPYALARTYVALVLGASFGVLVTAAGKLRRPVAPVAPVESVAT
jgi:hypothetical protein